MKKVVNGVAFVLALVLLFEEWLWDHLKAAVRRLVAGAAFRRMEVGLQALGPWPSVLVLALPAAVLVPFKLAAFWFMAQGRVGLGVLVLVAAKLVGTGLVAYLFDIVRPKARQLAWFDWGYVRVMELLDACRQWVGRQPAYVRAKVAVRGAQAWAWGFVRRSNGGWVSALGRRVRAARRVARRAYASGPAE